MDEAGLPGRTLSAAIIRIAGPTKIAGPAVCVNGAMRVSPSHLVKPLPPEALEENIEPGAVMVLSSGSMVCAAPIGGIVSRSLHVRGCAGIVTDAAIRDLDEIEELTMPVFAGGTSPANAARIWQFIDVGRPAVLPSRAGATLTVAPGDFILGDREGVVVIPAAAVAQIVEDAETLREIEVEIVREIKSGISRHEAFLKFPRFSHVRAALL
ncbi:hypothetical protein [Aminobacter sp. MSH1]|uniref:RraA family protein n=1 Tax=Aminobacter sp. MSH1 TaxID=374606 RepID=UPI00131EFEC1|nr:hypothetical protein [Aminobacter sp. MSH1]